MNTNLFRQVLRPVRLPVSIAEVPAAAKTVSQAVAASLLIALCAHISLVLPGSPVPHTMQTFAVLLLSLILAPKTSLLATLAYLLEGASGLPVFSPHGPGGVAQLAGLSGGYLLSYPAAALVTGLTFRTLRRRAPVLLSALVGGACGNLLILLGGSAYLAALTRLPLGQAIGAGALPFLEGDAFKLGLAALVATGLWSANRPTASHN